VYNLFGKDSNTGTIQGQIKGDTIFAEYTFLSEGRESVREIALLRKGNTLVEGYGEVKPVGNKMVFTSTSTLNFGNGVKLSKTNCQQDEHGCVTLLGYAWSELRNTCIQPLQSGIRLYAKGEKGSTLLSAFLLFSEDKKQAEVFLPGNAKTVLLTRKGNEGNYSWENEELSLVAWKGYVLKKGESLLYAGQ
jgi:hypothetical protein